MGSTPLLVVDARNFGAYLAVDLHAAAGAVRFDWPQSQSTEAAEGMLRALITSSTFRDAFRHFIEGWFALSPTVDAAGDNKALETLIADKPDGTLRAMLGSGPLTERLVGFKRPRWTADVKDRLALGRALMNAPQRPGPAQKVPYPRALLIWVEEIRPEMSRVAKGLASGEPWATVRLDISASLASRLTAQSAYQSWSASKPSRKGRSRPKVRQRRRVWTPRALALDLIAKEQGMSLASVERECTRARRILRDRSAHPPKTSSNSVSAEPLIFRNGTG